MCMGVPPFISILITEPQHNVLGALTLFRLKRYYALQDIVELFQKEKVDPATLVMNAEKGKLPLHLFDNQDFETRSPSQWYVINETDSHCFSHDQLSTRVIRRCYMTF